jgi:nucleoside-diphosphate-sugar epimerase
VKILISGASGFLGTYFVNYFSSLNINFVTIGRSNTCNIVIDITKEFEINEICDLFIHAAGKAHSTPRTNDEITDFYISNVLGTKNLLNALKNVRPKQFVYISSVSVYGLDYGIDINESTPLLAIDPYGKSKIDAEEMVKKWCLEHNVICTILRLPLVVGDNPPGNLGSMIRGIKKGYYFNISGGNVKKSMVLATDIAQFVIKAAEKGGIYNLTDCIHPSFNDLSKIIAIQMGKTVVPNLPKFIAILLAKIGDLFGNKFPINSTKLSKITSTLTFDDNRARSAFGWNPSPVLESFKIKKDVK